jgi:hypothetical protein
MRSFSDLSFFCKYIVDKYGSPGAATEDEKAEEFRNVYLRNLPPNLRTLKAVASACGINLSSLGGGRLPKNVRGYHDVFEGKRNIYYREDDTISGIENTILHEFREMIEPVFIEICPAYEPLRTIALHLAANRFATAVLLPRDEFEQKVYETGFDVIALSGIYSKSCSQVLLRMGEVLHGRIFFYAALYENQSPNSTDWKVTCWTCGRNEECPEANVSGLYDFFPKKGHPVVPGSLVETTIKTGKPHMIRHITIVDEIEEDGLTAISQPLFLPEPALSKVALVVSLQSESEKLHPQVRRLKPTVLESFYKHL